jgi:ADP-heptose:LPS heptosyltransferase
MWSEVWRSINHLLLCKQNVDTSIDSAVELLHQTLPAVEITWLTVQSDRAIFLNSTEQSTVILFELNCRDRMLHLIQTLRDQSFDAAIIFTTPAQFPYLLAYLCYLASIPIRIGQSQEFGGGVLSHCITPPIDPVPLPDYHLHLLKTVGLISFNSAQFAALIP